MTDQTPTQFLENLYFSTMALAGPDAESRSVDLSAGELALLNTILQNAESSKGVLTVVITSLVYKHFHPEQDIRNHQSGIPGGYSGRTFDSKYITPFLKQHRFPAMAESGWLTRSLEQKRPYDRNYSGAIRPETLRNAFLGLMENIEQGADTLAYFRYILLELIRQRNRQTIQLARPVNVPIAQITRLLTSHFTGKYYAEGAARLPVLALYAAYRCMIREIRRFEGKQLLTMESHTSADSRSGRIGDIDIIDEQGKPFEAVEVKHGIPISAQLVRDAFEKFSTTQVTRYYLLSTADVAAHEQDAVQKAIETIRNLHGCQVIVNGLTRSIEYYLRLLDNPSDFVDEYVTGLEEDKALKFEHKKRWNELVSGSAL